MWGGLVPDALIALSRLITSLHDDDGNVAVAGLHAGPAAAVEYSEDTLRLGSGAIAGLQWIGSGTAVERLWTKPSLTVTGLDAPKVDGASNTLTPLARARLSLRIAPGDTSGNAIARLREHCERQVPWGADVAMTVVEACEATQIDATGPVFDAARVALTEAWDGTAPIDMGLGGSIPFIAAFLEAYPGASVLVTGVEDPDTRAHGANESLQLAEFERVVLAEALLLRYLGGGRGLVPASSQPRHRDE
jgi:acetylornithine deacetylase/succinyl-diaminopimelate desuccinylase-like protein